MTAETLTPAYEIDSVFTIAGPIELDGTVNITANDPDPDAIYDKKPLAISCGTDSSNADMTIKGDITIQGGEVGLNVVGTGNMIFDNANANLSGMTNGLLTNNGQISFKNSTIVLDTSSRAIDDDSIVTFDYADGYHFYSGTSSEAAAEVTDTEAQKEHLSDKYLKIEPIIPVPATGISLNETNVALHMIDGSAECQLIATVEPENSTDKVNWTSSKEDVATVDSTGKVTAVGAGTTTITAKAGEKTATCTVTVDIPATDIELDQTTMHLYTNKEPQSGTLIATVTPETTTDKVTWTSSDEKVATVDENGVVTAVGNGTATITATAGEATATCEVTVSTYEAPVTPGPGPSRPDPDIDVAEPDHGTVTVTPQKPGYGDEVTITPQPDEGFVVDKVTVTDRNGDAVEVTAGEDGTYHFTQPWGKVTIEVTFTEEAETPATDVSEIFADIAPDAWYTDAVQYAYDNGLMTGTGEDTFAPNATTTRGMIVAILHRLEDEPAAQDAGFSDVADGSWYASAVAWAKETGIVNGYSDSTFGPNDAITREQMAAILMNYAEYKGQDVTASADLSGYADAGDISAWADSSMSWAVATGLLKGVTSDTLEPQGAATRAQVAAILQRFLAE